MMSELHDKIVIELTPWEAEQLNKGLKYLVDCHICNPENVKRIPDESLKAVSWIITFRINTLNKDHYIGKTKVHTR
ncbi:MAG: hypothetical protein NTW82_14045 [Bacteroidia bacterium]|nr:hypothetical protein [Bacteroidia bacterium]